MFDAGCLALQNSSTNTGILNFAIMMQIAENNLLSTSTWHGRIGQEDLRVQKYFLPRNTLPPTILIRNAHDRLRYDASYCIPHLATSSVSSDRQGEFM